MQILPTTATESISQAGTSAARDGLGFSRLFSDYLTSIPAEVTPLLGDAAGSGQGNQDTNPHAAVNRDEDMFASQAPYIQASSSSSFGVEEVRFTAEEVRQIAVGLQAEGLDAAVVNAGAALADNPMGVTTPDILKAIVSAVRSAAKVTDSDMERITAFLRKIDPKGELSDAVAADLLAGRTMQAWEKIIAALNSMDPEAGFDVTASEIASLGKALGLSAGTLDALHKSFGGADTLHLSRSGFQQLMTPAQHELGAMQAQLEKIAARFEKVLSPVAQQARMRITAENAAAGRADRNVDQSQILINDTVTKNSFARTDDPGKPALQTDAKDIQQQPTSADPAHASNAKGDRIVASVKEENSKGFQEESSGGQRPGSNKQGGAFDDATTERKGAWDNLLDKVSYQAANPALSGSATLAGAQQPGQQPLQHLPHYAPQVFKQVEQGILSAVKDGVQRLELQLTPENLGAVTVVLTTKNGEISALLRAERSETVEMMSQQAEQVRFALEQQGLKVDKVEVQAQLQDQRGGMSWQGMDQHNSSQQRQYQAQERERIMRLGRLLRGDSADMRLDRNMQNSMHGAREAAGFTGRGLHIVT